MNDFEMLLMLLRETLGDVDGRKKEAQKDLGEHQAGVRKRQEDLEDAERERSDAAHSDEQAARRVSVLCAYMKTLGNQPNALTMKMQALVEERQEAAANLRKAEEKVAEIRQDLDKGQHVLAAKEKVCDALTQEWNTISQLIANARATTRSAQ